MTEQSNKATPRKAAAKKATPKPRVRRTKAQIEADKAAEEAARIRLAEERAANIPQPKSAKWQRTIHILKDGVTVFGHVRYQGEEITIVEGTPEFDLAFDRDGNFIYGKTANEQFEAYGELRYGEGLWPYNRGYDISDTVIEADGSERKLDAQEIANMKKANKQRQLA